MENISLRLIALFLLTWAMYGAPQRIVSTGPSITEILFALGLGSEVVGATEYCNYPPEARKIRRIGTWVTPNMEAVLEVRPTLVIVQKTGIHDDTKFRALKLNTLLVRLESIEEILEAIRLIGQATGTHARATQLAAKLRGELEAVRKQVAGRPRPRTMFVVGRTPGALEGIIATGKGSYISEVMEIAGGRNVFDDSTAGYLKVVHEEILSRNPEVIVDMGEHPDASPISQAQIDREVAMWGKYASLSAVKNRRVHIVSSDLFVHAGPRVAELARTMARLLHPELYR